jgi:hypothetical protein
MAAVQPTLFEDPDAPDAELLGFIGDSLQAGPRTLAYVREFLLKETARWLPKHAEEAVRYLLADGRLSREPAAGRLTKDTRLWLKG